MEQFLLCRNKAVLLMLVSLALLLAGCAGTSVSSIKPSTPKPSDCHIEVFLHSSAVQRPNEVVCHLESRTGASLFHDHSISKAIQVAKPDACRCGADAIVLESKKEAKLSLTSTYRGRATLNAIRFTD
jgi:hypothetical protein